MAAYNDQLVSDMGLPTRRRVRGALTEPLHPEYAAACAAVRCFQSMPLLLKLQAVS